MLDVVCVCACVKQVLAGSVGMCVEICQIRECVVFGMLWCGSHLSQSQVREGRGGEEGDLWDVKKSLICVLVCMWS